MLSIALSLFILVMLVFLYKYREADEPYLGLKVLGYYVLGGFTFYLNDVALPLGFLIFLLFVRPATNGTTKRRAAYLGLAVFAVQLIQPVVTTYLFERPIVVDRDRQPMKPFHFSEEWNLIKEKLKLEHNIRLEDVRMEFAQDGKLVDSSYRLVGSAENSMIFYLVEFASEANQFIITRKAAEHPLYYGDLIVASRFFEVLDVSQLPQKILDPSFDRYVLYMEGKKHTFHTRYEKYVIDESDIKPIFPEQLPINGYVITVCSNSGSSSGCHKQVEYYFDTIGIKP